MLFVVIAEDATEEQQRANSILSILSFVNDDREAIGHGSVTENYGIPCTEACCVSVGCYDLLHCFFSVSLLHSVRETLVLTTLANSCHTTFGFLPKREKI